MQSLQKANYKLRPVNHTSPQCKLMNMIYDTLSSHFYDFLIDEHSNSYK